MTEPAPRVSNPNKAVGANLRAARLAHGWTQRELSARLGGEMGKSFERTAISSFELGNRSARLDELMALSAALGVTLEVLLGPVITRPVASRRLDDALQLVAHLLDWVEASQP